MGEQLQLLILQLGVILIVGRATGLLLRRLGQPQVIGEMLGGLLLGPSVLGLIYGGDWLHRLFPASSMPSLEVLAQLGVMLFMFLVGLELDVSAVAKQGRRVALAGFASILGPFFWGLLVALVLWSYGHVRGEAQSGLAFVLFMATALSISAFPVLARILSEHNLTKAPVGILALACAAINDAVGWCILAVVYDVSQSVLTTHGVSTSEALFRGVETAVFAAMYVGGMLILVRPLLRRMQAHFESRGYLSRTVVALLFVLILASALTTSLLGIHLIFGAFMLGAVMPSEPRFVRHVFDKIEDIAVLFLLPTFFATIGLKTDLAQFHGTSLWCECALLLLAAMTMKITCSAMAARYGGLKVRESLLLGVLMSSHGVMELIVVSIALEIGAISTRAFTMMIVVVIGSTVLVSPLMRLLYSRRRMREELIPVDASDLPGMTVVVPVSLPESAGSLVELAAMLLGVPRETAGRVVVVQVRRPEDPAAEASGEGAAETALGAARRLGVAARAMTFVGRNAKREIIDTVRQCGAAWIVMGYHKPVFVQSILGGTVAGVLREAPANVAILVSKGDFDSNAVRRVLVPYLGGEQDVGVLGAAERLARLPDVRVTILHVVKPGRSDASEEHLGVGALVDRYVTSAGAAHQVHMRVVESDSPIDMVAEESHRYDLMVLGLSPRWKLEGGILGANEESAAQLSACPLLIVRAAAETKNETR